MVNKNTKMDLVYIICMLLNNGYFDSGKWFTTLHPLTCVCKQLSKAVSDHGLVKKMLYQFKRVCFAYRPIIPLQNRSLLYMLGSGSLGFVELVQHYLSLGVNINAKHEILETTVLDNACRKGNYELVKMLLDYGAKVDVYGPNYRSSSLYCACRSAYSKIVRLLLKNGGDVNRLSLYNHNLLHTIIQSSYFAKDYLDTVKVLVENHIYIHQKNAIGETPLDLAKKNGYDEVVRYLTNVTYKNIMVKIIWGYKEFLLKVNYGNSVGEVKKMIIEQFRNDICYKDGNFLLLDFETETYLKKHQKLADRDEITIGQLGLQDGGVINIVGQAERNY